MQIQPLQWHTPQPLWARFGSTLAEAVAAQDQYRPAILRFASDEFMEQMLTTLARDSLGIADLLARPETWRSPIQSSKGQAEGNLLDRIPIPSTARAVARRLALRKPKTPVASVPASRSITEKTSSRELPLKLYQPAHQRYYLVSASLVCGQMGLPDRAVTRGGSEQVGFVLRRLMSADPKQDPTGELHEYGFVKGADAARWQRVSDDGDDGVLVPGEEILPLFPLAFNDEREHSRTLWSGLIPVGRREEYTSAPVVTSSKTLDEGRRQALGPQTVSPPPGSKTARLTQFRLEVAEPWKNLIRTVYQAHDSLAETVNEGDETAQERLDRIRSLNLQWQMQSWLILLDFADFLQTHLRPVWDAIGGNGTSAAALNADPSGEMAALYAWLGRAQNFPVLAEVIGPDSGKAVKNNLREALKAIGEGDIRQRLEAAENLYTKETMLEDEWPAFHFLLAGLDGQKTVQGRPIPRTAGAFTNLDELPAASFDGLTEEPDGFEPEPVPAQGPPLPKWLNARVAADAVDRLTALIGSALPTGDETKAPPVPFALQLRDAISATTGDEGWFVIRCVYLNRECGPLHPPVVSPPTQRFKLASFFDPDAPARPIRISLPTDTTPAGLRRHSRGTAFVISDLLCGQIQRAKGLGLVDLVRSVLPWPLHKDLELGTGGKCEKADGLDIGMICSLSIPIITICALILLIIMVTVLDYIFRWLPYFIACFPLPKLRGKSETSP